LKTEWTSGKGKLGALAGAGKPAGAVAGSSESERTKEANTYYMRLRQLLTQQVRNNAEQDEANSIARLLKDRVGDVGVKYDELGNAVGLASDSIERFNRVANGQKLETLRTEIANLTKRYGWLTKEMDRVSKMTPEQRAKTGVTPDMVAALAATTQQVGLDLKTKQDLLNPKQKPAGILAAIQPKEIEARLSPVAGSFSASVAQSMFGGQRVFQQQLQSLTAIEKNTQKIAENTGNPAPAVLG
jgi:hypothetical protein